MGIATQAEITQGLKSLLSLTMIYDVTSNGFIQNVDTGQRVMINVNGEKKPIFVYNESLPDGNDYVVFNPLNEHVASFEPASSWFYNVMRSALFARLREAIHLTIVFMQKNNRVEISDEYQNVPTDPSPKCLTKIAAKNMGKNKPLSHMVDKETLIRINEYLDTDDASINFIYAVYNKKYRKATLNVPLITQTEEDWESGTDKKRMRKNDVTVLKNILHGIFGNLGEEWEEKAPSITGPGKLTTLLSVYYLAYEKLMPFLEIIDQLMLDEDIPSLCPDLSVLSGFIGNIERFSKGVLWLVPGGKDPVKKESVIPDPQTSIPTHHPTHRPTHSKSSSGIPDPSDYFPPQNPYNQGFNQPSMWGNQPSVFPQQFGRPNMGYTGQSRFGNPAPQFGQPTMGGFGGQGYSW